MIKAERLSYGYGNAFRLQEVSFEVQEGEFWGIIGPNGSGKSTLLRVLSRILTPQNGTVHLDGKSLQEISLRDLAKLVAVVGSEAQFAFPYRVWEVVLMGRIPFVGRLGNFGSRDREIVEKVLRTTESWDLRDRYVMDLSSGERQRILLARALAQEPRILFLDEPTAHLDLHFEIEIFHLLRDLNSKSRLTILTISHNLNLIAEYCSKIIVLHNGKCFQIGSPQQILTPALLNEVFRIEGRIITNPYSGAPTLLLKP